MTGPTGVDVTLVGGYSTNVPSFWELPTTCTEIKTSPDPLCSGVSHTFELKFTGGKAPIAVEWDYYNSTPDGVDGSGNPWATSLPSGDWTVQVTATDANSESCTISIPVSVLQTPSPVATALGPTVFCVTRGESCTLELDRSYGTIQWTKDGTDIPGANGQSYTATQTGKYATTVTDNGCCGTSGEIQLDAESCGSSPPGEVSCMPDSEPPLLASKVGNTLIVEKEQLATVYNIYVDSLGSWYYPTLAKGSVCHISTWTDNGDGTVTLDLPSAPENVWFVVTASNADGEGPAGDNSAGIERSTIGNWESCGSFP